MACVRLKRVNLLRTRLWTDKPIASPMVMQHDWKTKYDVHRFEKDMLTIVACLVVSARRKLWRPRSNSEHRSQYVHQQRDQQRAQSLHLKTFYGDIIHSIDFCEENKLKRGS